MPERLLPLINGLVGDALPSRHKWRISLSLRFKGKDVSVAEIGKKLKGRQVVVLVHGLMADERIWKYLGPGLALKVPVLYIRYNTGLHISHYGRALAKLLNELQQKLG